MKVQEAQRTPNKPDQEKVPSTYNGQNAKYKE